MLKSAMTLKTLECGRPSVGLGGVFLAFDEALHVGFFAWLQSDGWALSLGDRLPANHTDRFLAASLLPHGGTPNSFLTPTVVDTLRERGCVVSDYAHWCLSGRRGFDGEGDPPEAVARAIRVSLVGVVSGFAFRPGR